MKETKKKVVNIQEYKEKRKQTEIKNVKIQENEFKIDETNVTVKSSPIINIGENMNKLTNVKFLNNNLDIKAGSLLFWISNS